MRDGMPCINRVAARLPWQGLPAPAQTARAADARAGSPCHGKRGFTLVEVLATLVLVAIVLPVTMRGISLALSAASKARHTSEAATLAESKLNELVVTQAWNGGGSGDFSPDHPDYRWRLQTAARDFNATEVTVSIFWTERGQEQSLNVTTLAYISSNTSGGGAP